MVQRSKSKRRTKPSHSATTSDATTFETNTEASSSCKQASSLMLTLFSHQAPQQEKQGIYCKLNVRNLSKEQKSEPSETTGPEQYRRPCGQSSGQCDDGDLAHAAGARLH